MLTNLLTQSVMFLLRSKRTAGITSVAPINASSCAHLLNSMEVMVVVGKEMDSKVHQKERSVTVSTKFLIVRSTKILGRSCIDIINALTCLSQA